jgi:hypothetical protein
MFKNETVIPAKAGIQGLKSGILAVFWIPAFAGMTVIQVFHVNCTTC